ncbi:Ubiquitin carboxyl-terminal hydrolase 44 [Schistosoma japonicum]|nr:Ubiquitin carboxyl-terminal hydrolase 44 [Schistosoma japonicum]
MSCFMTENCKHVLKIKTSIQLGILYPERWHCNTCRTTESVWACLSCSNFACGRYISEHALQHFRQTNHPLCIEVNEKFVYCYICDDFVLNDNAPGDIKLLRMALDAVTTQDFGKLVRQKRGRRILRFRGKDAEKNNLRLLKADDIHTAVIRHRISRLSWALHLWWSRYAESKLNTVISKKTTKSKNMPLRLTPAFTGLRNLGNTCYMNSILQILRHTAAFSNYIMNHTLSEINSHSRKRHSHSRDLSIEDSICPVKRPAIPSLFLKNQVVATPHNCENLWSSLPTGTPSCPPNTENKFCHYNESNLVSLRKNIIPMCGSSGGLNGGQCAKFVYDGYQRSPSSLVNPQVSSVPSLYDEIHSLFRLLWSGQRSIVSPSNLLNAVWSNLPTFKGYKQQDAQEFLSLLLDRLQAELHGVPMAVSVTNCDFISRAFRGYSVSHIRCSTCHVTACTEEPIYELSLSLPTKCHSDESCTCDIIDLLRQFVSPSPIDGASYACVKCNQCSEINKEGTEFTRSILSECNYDSNHLSSLSYPVNKIVSIALSRLASPSCSPHLSYPDLSTSCELTENFSLSESPLSATSSVTGLDEQYANSSAEKSLEFNQHSIVQSPKDVPAPLSRNSLLTHATQTIRLSKLPRVLRLHIKRFRWVGRQREKLTCHVSFPLILNMSEFMLSDMDKAECRQPHLNQTSYDQIHEPEGSGNNSDCHQSRIRNLPKEFENSSHQYLYHLTGVVVHHGRGFQSGHYTAYCLNDNPECWLHCNDANVSLCDFSEVASAQAYLLFYSELIPRTPLPTWYKDFITCESSSSTILRSISESNSLKNQPNSPSCSSKHESTYENV